MLVRLQNIYRVQNLLNLKDDSARSCCMILFFISNGPSSHSYRRFEKSLVLYFLCVSQCKTMRRKSGLYSD